MTYEQFAAWCEYWGYTTDEGFKAMCFVHNIIGQHVDNKAEYQRRCEHRGSSEDFLLMVQKSTEKALSLYFDYGDLNNCVFSMLEEHDKEAPTTCDKVQPKED